MWWQALRRAAAESSVPKGNWRWMLSSAGVGAGFGLVGGLHRLGSAPATITADVALTAGRVALVFFAVTWFVATAVRLGRSLWTRNG